MEKKLYKKKRGSTEIKTKYAKRKNRGKKTNVLKNL